MESPVNQHEARKTFVFARDLCVGDTLCFTHSAGDVVIEEISESITRTAVGLHANNDTWIAFYDKNCRMRVIRGAEGRALDTAAAIELAKELTLAPLEAQAFIEQVKAARNSAASIPLRDARVVAHFAPPSSPVHEQVDEARRIAIDMAYDRMKNSGELRRMEERRAIALDRQWGVA